MIKPNTLNRMADMDKQADNHEIHFWHEIKLSGIAALALGLLLCGVYPVVVWGVSQAFFPHKANGSLIENDKGAVIGSELLGQVFTAPKYFHSRPSAAGSGYDATSSGGSNLGQTSKVLMDSLKARVDRYRAENGITGDTPIPGDAVTASASGLDPDISLDNALLQVQRVAKARGLDPVKVEGLARRSVRGRDLGFLGEPGVNVLELNLALDKGM